MTHGGRIGLLLQSQTLVPASETVRNGRVQPLGGIDLRNDIIFKHQWLLYHKQLFLALGRPVITV